MKYKKLSLIKYSNFVDINNISWYSTSGNDNTVKEDCFYNLKLDSCYFLALFDGVGGIETSEYATKISIDAITRELTLYEGRNPKYAINRAFSEANRLILLRKTKFTEDNIGVTVAGALVREREFCLANIGNCRAYLIRGNSVQKLTKDHTYIQELIDNGIKPTQEELETKKHELTRMLGHIANIQVATYPLWIWDSKDCDEDINDIVMFCSDGLYEYINKDEVSDIISKSNNNYTQACKDIVELAITNGSKDDVSIILMPINGQLRNVVPPRYKPPKDENAVQELDNDIDVFDEEDEKDNNAYFYLQVFILTILFNFISLMGFIISVN